MAEVNLKIDTKWLIVFILLGAILSLQLYGVFGQSSSKNTRTITATGEASKKVDPDEFVFSPYYEITGTDDADVRAKVAEKGTAVVAALEKIGVKSEEIKLNANDYDFSYFEEKDDFTVNMGLTISLSEEKFAEEVQNFLLQDGAKGQITSNPQVSRETRKQAELSLEDEAIEAAKADATRQAEKLGAKLGKVVSINPGSNGAEIYPLSYSGAEDSVSSLPFLPGQNEVQFNVTVVYQLR